MTRLKLAGLALCAAALVASAPAQAATVSPSAAPTPLASPTAPVTRLAPIYRKAAGMSFTASMLYTSQTLAGKPIVKRFDITGELTKPEKYVYRGVGAGTVASDGHNTIAEDAALTHYARFPSTPGFTLGPNWDFVHRNLLKGNSALIDYTLPPYLFGHISDPDFLQPENMTITGTLTMQDGKSVQDVEYKDVAVDVHLYFDPVTGNLTGDDSTYFIAGRQSFEVRETITKLTLSPTALPAVDFVTVPPPGATQVAIPAPKTPKAKVNRTTRPARTPYQKQWRNIGGVWVYR